MKYAKYINGVVEQYPYSYAQLKKDNPFVSFPDSMQKIATLDEYDVYPVVPQTAPVYDKNTEKLKENLPVWNVNQLEQNWSVIALDQSELDAIENARVTGIYEERDRRVDAEIASATPSHKSKDYLLMRSARLNNIRGSGQRPLTQDEIDEENALELMMDEVDRLHTVADDAVTNGTALEDITW